MLTLQVALAERSYPILIGQSLLAGLFTGGLYALLGLGLSVTWGLLRVINLANFALAFLGAYLTYQLATAHGLDFAALQLRLHPAESRVEKLAKETPSSFVAFDVLAIAGRDVMTLPQGVRRAALEKLLDGVRPPAYLTPVTRDRATHL